LSNFLAIATVTAALQSLLQGAVGADVPGATATIVRPDGSDNGLPGAGVNIYLYQVTPNSAWRNADLPTRTGDSRLIQRPRVALDLHYLLTFYGAEALLEPQRVLGSVARTLHAQPVLTRSHIQETIEALTDDDPNHFLGDSNLAEEVELVKFMPLSLSLEELSKLWSVFFQTPYTLSMAYLATTVLIETDESPQRTLPVRVRNLTVTPFQQAVVKKVVADTGEHDPVALDDAVVIQGERLAGAVRAIRVGAAELAPTVVSNREIRLVLTGPDLRAGLQGVQVLYANGAESNVVPLILRPRIAVDQANVTATALPIGLAPAVGRQQRVVLYLNEFDAPADRAPRAYSLPAPANNGITDPAAASTASITFPIDNVESGAYLVRVQVAGAESLLVTDAAGRYNAPQVTIP
jgi:hypothetical protein